jgi:hypothetical protein
MGAEKGSAFLLKVGNGAEPPVFATVARYMRTTQLSVNGEAGNVDFERLEGMARASVWRGVRSVSKRYFDALWPQWVDADAAIGLSESATQRPTRSRSNGRAHVSRHQLLSPACGHKARNSARRRQAERARSWYVKLWDYASGAPEDVQVTLDFGGVDPEPPSSSTVRNWSESGSHYNLF